MAVSRWPEVRTRPTLQRTRASSASAASRHVEGAVAGDGERAGCLDERGHADLVDGAIGGQAADDHAGDAEFAKRRDVGQHRTIFVVAIEKIAAAWPHDDVERNFRQFQAQPCGAEAGRDAALDKAGAELDAVGAGALGGKQAVNAFHADFNHREFFRRVEAGQGRFQFGLKRAFSFGRKLGMP